MELKEFIKAHNLTTVYVSNCLNLHWNTVANWMKGTRVPSPESMIEIYKFTKGEVTPNDFYDLPDLKKK